MRHQSHALTLSISLFSPSERFHPSADMAQGTLASTPWIKSLGCDFERVEASRRRARPEDKTSLQTGLSEESAVRNPLVFSGLTWTLSKCQVVHKRKKNWDGKVRTKQRELEHTKRWLFHNSECVWGISQSRETYRNLEKTENVLSSQTEQQIKSNRQSICLNIHFSGLKYRWWFSHQNANMTLIHMQTIHSY